MSEVSVAQAKARFAELVHQAESGQPVRITRRGRAVAVLVSEADFLRLEQRKQGLLAYSDAWRARALEAGSALPDGPEWDGLRDPGGRASPDLR